MTVVDLFGKGIQEPEHLGADLAYMCFECEVSRVIEFYGCSRQIPFECFGAGGQEAGPAL